MDTFKIFLIVLALTVLAVRLYLKYVKKDKTGSGAGSPGTSIPKSRDTDDDYEPYSKR